MGTECVGVTLVRGVESLNYPFELTLKSFGPCSKVFIGLDAEDSEKDKAKERAVAVCGEKRAVFVESRWSGTDAAGFRARLAEVLRAADAGMGAALDGRFCLYLESDEMMDPRDVRDLVRERPLAAWLPRLQLWQFVNQLRLDWTVSLPRFADLGAMMSGYDKLDGDASELPVHAGMRVAQFAQWPIYHLSRVGSPYMIARRREAVAKLWSPEADIDVPEEYDFTPRRFENWERGQMPGVVTPILGRLSNNVPDGIPQWVREDMKIGMERARDAYVARVEAPK